MAVVTYTSAPVPVHEVTMTLSFKEALVLARILGHIRGAGSLREYLDAFWDGLVSVPGLNVPQPSPYKNDPLFRDES